MAIPVGLSLFRKDIVLAFTAAFGNIDCASLLLLMLGGIHKVVYVTMAVNVCVGKVSSAGNSFTCG